MADSTTRTTSGTRGPRNQPSRCGQVHDERGAPARGVARLDPAAVRVDDAGHDREPQARAAAAALPSALRAPEPLEDLARVVGRQAGPVVAHLEAPLAAVARRP